MKVTLDSSVLIAAYVTRAGVCAELLEDILRRHELILSQHILDEVSRKLTHKFLFPPRLVSSVVDSLEKAAAIAGDAEFLVSADKDLLDLQCYGTVAIIRPGEFWARVTP